MLEDRGKPRLAFVAILTKNTPKHPNKGDAVKSLPAREAKYHFGRLIDLARAEPVLIEKHGRPVVVVLSVEAYERLVEAQNITGSPAASNIKA